MTRFLLGFAQGVLFAAFAIAVLAFASPAHAAPCFDSVEAARTAYPRDHIAWQGRGHNRQYFKGRKGQHVKCDGAGADRTSSLTTGAATPPPHAHTLRSEPPPSAPPDWSIPIKTVSVAWPADVKFDPPPAIHTREQMKAAPQKEETASLVLAFAGPASMMLGFSLIVLGWMMKP